MSILRVDNMGWFAPLWNVLWRVGVAVIVAWLAWHLGTIIVTFLLAAVFAYFVNFGVDYLTRYKWLWVRDNRTKRMIACLLCYAVLVGCAWIATVQASHPVKEGIAALSANWETYRDTIDKQQQDLNDFYVKNLPPDVRETLSGWFGRVMTSFGQPAAGAPKIPILGWIGFVVELILVPVIAFYFIVDGRAIKREIFQFIPPDRTRLAARIAREVNVVMRQYTMSQVILCMIAGVVTWFIFLMLPEAREYAVIVGIYAAITRAIPVAGAIIGGIPIVALAALSVGSVSAGIVVAVLFTLLHFLESKLIYPIIVGNHVKMHPVIVIAALLIGFEFFGILGMFFAPPIAAITRNVWLYVVKPGGRPLEVELEELAATHAG